MHTNRSNLAVFATGTASIFATALLTLAATPAASAAPRCENPGLMADRKACEKAREGADALRRFVSRTQSIYGLYFWDYIMPEQMDRQATTAAPDSRVAKAE
jgi:hypothetical protein